MAWRRDDVRDALWRDRTLVKTWAMRGTLHLVASDELPELVGALGTRINWLRPVWLRYFEVTADEMLALQDAIGDVLSDKPMTRAALATALARHLGNEAFAERVSSGWGTFLKPAASRGLLCFGPDDGRNVTFVDPARLARARDARAHRGRHRRRHRAPPRRVPRQLAGRARALVGRPGRRAAAEADRGPRRSRGGGAGRRHEGAGPARRRRHAPRTSTPSTGLRLLPAFDPYTLSLQKEAEPLLPLARRPLVSRTAGWISQVRRSSAARWPGPGRTSRRRAGWRSTSRRGGA